MAKGVKLKKINGKNVDKAVKVAGVVAMIVAGPAGTAIGRAVPKAGKVIHVVKPAAKLVSHVIRKRKI